MPLPHTWVSADCVCIVIIMLLVDMWPLVAPRLRLEWLPRSVFAIVMGLAIGWIWSASLPVFIFEPDLFLFLLLPPIIFESGLTFRRETLETTWKSSLMLAGPGTILSALLIAWGAMALQRLGLAGDHPYMSVIEAFAFGAILSPTDPVATLSIMRQHKDRVAPHIRHVVENESLMNDAVAVALVHLAGHLRALNSSTVAYVVFMFFLTTVGSVVWGTFLGMLVRLMSKPSATFLMLLALFVYASAEAVSASGIVSLFTYGVVISKSAPFMISHAHTLSELGEMYIYIVMGCMVYRIETRFWAYAFGVVVACIVSRVASIFFLGGVLRFARVWRLSELLFVSMCGIRGAIALALAFSLAGPHAQMIRAATFTVVVSSTLIFGSLTQWMIEAFRIDS